MATTELAVNPKATAIQVFLEKQIQDLKKACPQHLTPERLIQVAIICCYRNPALLECDPNSLLTSVIQALSLGLDISPTMGEVYLIPRWNSKARIQEVQFQPGYRGLVKLARQASGIKYIQSETVREKDVFRAYRDPDWKIHHEPHFGKDGGEVKAVYAVAKFATGEYQLTVLARDEVEDIRKRSQSGNSGPWVTDWNEMAKKTALKRLCKGLPNNADPTIGAKLDEAIAIDNRDYEDSFDEASKAGPANNSGHGKGMYASQEQTDAFLKKMDDYLAKRNGEWLDRWTGDGEIPSGLKKDLCGRWQADKHLVKWGVDTGRLEYVDMEKGLQNRLVGRYTAIIYHRSKDEQKAIALELKRYVDEQERMALDRLQRENPELFEQAEVLDDDPLDGLTADNYVKAEVEREPGCDDE